MFEQSFNDRERLPNYDDGDYILVGGRKILNPDWEKARENRKKNYFRCPDCNQGMIFFIDDLETNKLYYIHPKTNKDGHKTTDIMDFDYFEETVYPALFQYVNLELQLGLGCNMDPSFDIFAHTYYCYRCFKGEGIGLYRRYTPEVLIEKYKNPLDDSCDYTDICNICGDQIMQTIIPRKEETVNQRVSIPLEQSLIMQTRYICSNYDCNYIYI
jgi:hypothetical protein